MVKLNEIKSVYNRQKYLVSIGSEITSGNDFERNSVYATIF